MTASSSNPKKRKADVLSRLSQSKLSSGRGGTTGWVTCPLCGRYSQKKFALGRGIATHLHAVHTPWKPGKVEWNKRKRMEQRRFMELQRHGSTNTNSSSSSAKVMSTSTTEEKELTTTTGKDSSTRATWIPTEKEVEEWNEKVIQIVTQLEKEALATTTTTTNTTSSEDGDIHSNIQIISAGLDRNGCQLKDYRQSLPEFLQAAADGNLIQLEYMYEEVKKKTNLNNVQESLLALLNTKDRHLSTAEHWAAGSGHLTCLKWIKAKQKECMVEEWKSTSISTMTTTASTTTTTTTITGNRTKVRRRDGKTALHYAARNGHLPCIRFLVEECGYEVNAPSGDGTTPFHLACFGAHIDVAQYLIQQGGDGIAQSSNEWECSPAHWVAMTKNDSTEDVIRFCQFLKTDLGISFVTIQKQGHSPLHKAAQKLNRSIIEWMLRSKEEGGAGLSRSDLRIASQPDHGGHFPYDIWNSVGGDKEFGKVFEDQIKCIHEK